MEAHVIIATKGRPECLPALFALLRQQVLPVTTIVVVGTQPSDISSVDEASAGEGTAVVLCVSERPGLCIQRNVGLNALAARGVWSSIEGDQRPNSAKPSFVAFFDDDFRPASDWLLRCAEALTENPNIAAVSGRVLADGIHGPTAISEEAALEYLTGVRPARPHWASGEEQRELGSMYGCNMAFRSVVVQECRFDENLPLYGWQEDQDMTGQARRFGRTVYHPACRGVHLGSKSARVSGVRFGYSQVANPLYLVNKGTMTRRKTTRFLARHLVANTVKSVLPMRTVDYPGRLKGNFLALVDVVKGRCHPTRILDL